MIHCRANEIVAELRGNEAFFGEEFHFAEVEETGLHRLWGSSSISCLALGDVLLDHHRNSAEDVFVVGLGKRGGRESLLEEDSLLGVLVGDAGEDSRGGGGGHGGVDHVDVLLLAELNRALGLGGHVDGGQGREKSIYNRNYSTTL